MPMNGGGVHLKLTSNSANGAMAKLTIDGIDVSPSVLGIDLHVDGGQEITASIKFWVRELDVDLLARVNATIEPALVTTPADAGGSVVTTA